LAGSAKDPLWYKDAIIYEAHVRAFFDSNADGIGDLAGLTQKLDYLQDLGITAIWVLPFYPSPLKDDGYDIADYCSINPMYGTLRDFKIFLKEAHRRRLRVITELVVNHTSDQHPWFQRSRRAKPGSMWRNYYVWSDRSDKYPEARLIFRDFETSNWTWDPVARAYFWHRFYSHQPDLNYDNPQVHKEMRRVLDFWLDLGVDGFRLDAVPYLYERPGTSCENLPETHQYLKSLRQHVDEKYGDRMLLAEANQWPEDAVTYFGSGKGDECHMAFHFPLMPRIFMAVRMEDRVPIVDILEQTPPIPETAQWALFLRNHDELTLEMVTDEERDYMYRVYANDARARLNLGIRRRLAPLLGNDRKRIELLYLLLFSYPGTPVLYYGDEIGMGDNIFLGDRNGVRTPMQWSSDKNAGFSRASPQALYLPVILDPEYHYEAVNVEAQQRNPNSLWWWMKQTLTLRQRYQAFGRGSLHFLHPTNRKILAFVRRYEEQTILVIANLSRFPQPAQLDLSEFKQTVPVELFGRTHFPAITEQPYFLTLNPHAAFWFELVPATEGSVALNRATQPLGAAKHWEELLHPNRRAELENRLAVYLKNQRWFAGRNRQLKAVSIRDSLPVPGDGTVLLILAVEYQEGDPEEYLVPLAFAQGAQREQLERDSARFIIAPVQLTLGQNGQGEGLLYDAVGGKPFCLGLLEAMSRRRSFNGADGEVSALPARALRSAGLAEFSNAPPSAIHQSDRTNTTITFDDKYLLKLFRRIQPGPNPDLEVTRFLSERHFPNVPALAGSLEYRCRNGEETTLGVLTQYYPHAKDAWDHALDTLSRFFERVRVTRGDPRSDLLADGSLLELAKQQAPEPVVAMLGTYLELARLLGQRTGELHHLLASCTEDSNFAPEPFTPFYQRSLYQSMRNVAVQNLEFLRLSYDRIDPAIRPDAERVAALENCVLDRLRLVYEKPITAMRIRCHGDFHLGQVLYTGKDYVIIDFEGEPWRSMGQRRLKRTPLRDVAGMIGSFDYVVHAALFKQFELGTLRQEELAQLEPWAAFWYRWVGAAYLRAYLEVLGPTGLLPAASDQLGILFETHLLEKALSELSYEILHESRWVGIPLRRILDLMARSPAA